MLPQAHCVHQAPARFRVRIPAAKGDGALLRGMQEGLSRCTLVTATRANPLTGSLLVFHAADLASVASYAQENGIFTLVAHPPRPGRFASDAVSGYRIASERVRRLTCGELDLAQAVVVALVGTGLYQLARRKISAPPWHTAFWYALSIFMKAKDSE